MESVSIEQFLNAKINKKAQVKIGELSVQLFEAQAKADLLQELYNKAEKELQELKGQTPAEEAEVVEITPPMSNRQRRRQEQRMAQKNAAGKNDK